MQTDSIDLPRPKTDWYIQDVIRITVMLLTTTSYLITVGNVYNWLIILAISPFVLFGAAIVTFVLSLSTDHWFFRLLWLSGGITLAYSGAIEPHRLGSITMGLALILTSMCPLDELPQTPYEKSVS